MRSCVAATPQHRSCGSTTIRNRSKSLQSFGMELTAPITRASISSMTYEEIESSAVLNFLVDGPKTAAEIYAACGRTAGRELGLLVQSGRVVKSEIGATIVFQIAEHAHQSVVRDMILRLQRVTFGPAIAV